jgi:Zn-dependent protease
MGSGIHSIGREEIKDIVIADAVLILAFSMTMAGGILSPTSRTLASFMAFLPIAALGVTLSFVLHELMHKFVAQRYGAVAAFRSSSTGLMITLATGAMGFLLGIPGATVIYTNRFTKRENGVVSLAGPLTNIAVFAVFYIAAILINPAQGSYISSAIYFVIFISVLLAFFNMLPIYPLDGSKVLAWNKYVYAAVLLPILGLLLEFNILSLGNIGFMLIIALVFSIFYRRIL